MNLTYDERSFLIDGKRIWLVVGEVHYFRLPKEEWREALLRAKRAGLNTVSTYVAWNFHEQREGQPDFSGDRDLGAYIDLIGELGMYAMVRPGPYICSEWDGGGLPAWLCTGDVRRFREDDPVYMAAVERWFDALMPIIAARQITKGGPVITVQNENEYPGGWDESMRRYILKLNGIFARHGIQVPILACNVHAASKTAIQINSTTVEADQFLDPSMILTYNHYTETEQIRELRRRQPNAPLVVTEFWSGAPLYWGNGRYDWPSSIDQARAVYEYTAEGAQVDYYMFEGGTNFGFWGGNNIATTYAASYPVGDAGKLTEKYYAIHPVNLFLTRFGEIIAESMREEGGAGLGCPDGVRLDVRRSAAGAIAYLSVADGRKEIDVTLPDGRHLAVGLGDVPACALPLGLKLFGGSTVDYSNLCLLGKDDSRHALLLFGPAGTQGIVSIDGQEASIPVQRRAVQHMELSGIHVIVADEEMARRCWLAEEDIVFGPDYVGERNADGSLDIFVSDTSPAVVHLGKDGRPTALAVSAAANEAQQPQMGPWTVTPCPEAGPWNEGGWSSLDAPCAHEKLGVTQGYLWYAAEYNSDREGVEQLLVTNTANRVTVFVNGKYCGTQAARRSVRMRDEYGHPADWAMEEIPVRLQKGRNRFMFLSDDLGHNYDVPVPVGIQGPAFVGSRMADVTHLADAGSRPVSADAAYFLHCRDYRDAAPLPAYELALPLRQGEAAFLVIHGVHAWLTADGADVLPMIWPEAPWTMFAQIKRWISWTLPQAGADGVCRVQIQAPGWTRDEVLENMAVYIVPRAGELSGWRWKRWERPHADAAAEAVEQREGDSEDPLVLLPAKSAMMRKARRLVPAFFETEFSLPQGNGPVFFVPGEMRKGQIYLNSHNIGRFWQGGGTQDRYYLPRAWMGEKNRLQVFEELGILPQNAALSLEQGHTATKIKLELQ